MVAVPLLVKENSRRGVIVQALYRGNCVLFAVPLAENVFGAEGASLASMVLAFIIPIYNVMAVLILEYFRGGKPSLPQLLKKMEIDLSALQSAAQAEIARAPKVSGGEQYLSSADPGGDHHGSAH